MTPPGGRLPVPVGRAVIPTRDAGIPTGSGSSRTRSSGPGHGSGHRSGVGYSGSAAPICTGGDGIDYGDSPGLGYGRSEEMPAALWAVWLVTGWPLGAATAVFWLLRTLPASGPHRVGLLPVTLAAAGLTLAVLVLPIAARLLLRGLFGLAGLAGQLLARAVVAVGVRLHDSLRRQRSRWTQRHQHPGSRREPVVHVEVVDSQSMTITTPTANPLPHRTSDSAHALPSTGPGRLDTPGVGVPVRGDGTSRTR
jgi:hypothetical protein